MKNNRNIKGPNYDDATKYGEFISSYFGWITLNRQKERGKDLENMTKNDNKE